MTIHLAATGLIVSGAGLGGFILATMALLMVFTDIDTGRIPGWVGPVAWLLWWASIITFIIGIGMMIQFEIQR